jgi:hypothetical protein
VAAAAEEAAAGVVVAVVAGDVVAAGAEDDAVGVEQSRRGELVEVEVERLRGTDDEGPSSEWSRMAWGVTRAAKRAGPIHSRRKGRQAGRQADRQEGDYDDDDDDDETTRCWRRWWKVGQGDSRLTGETVGKMFGLHDRAGGGKKKGLRHWFLEDAWAGRCLGRTKHTDTPMQARNTYNTPMQKPNNGGKMA